MKDENKKWDEWEFIELLSEDNETQVYKAKRESFNLTFYAAVKIITIPSNNEEKYLQDMNEEEKYDYYKEYVDEVIKRINDLEKLKGAKNIVNIEDYKVVEDKGKWYIYIRTDLLPTVNEYFYDTSLREIDVVNIGLDMCEALENCQKVGIIHGNIKPSNIFVSKFKEYMLGDFSIMKSFEVDTYTTSRKDDYMFMAPEIYHNYNADIFSEIYSLGIVMYYLLNKNRCPFMPDHSEKLTPQKVKEALLKRMNGEEIPKLTDVSDDLYNILRKCCAYQKEERYISYKELKNDLKKIAQKESQLLESSLNSTVNIFSKRRAQKADKITISEEKSENNISDTPKAKEGVVEPNKTIKLGNKIANDNLTQNEKESESENAEVINVTPDKGSQIENDNKNIRNKEKKQRKSSKNGLIIFTCLIAILAIIIVAFWGISMYKKNRDESYDESSSDIQEIKIVVPNVVGMEYEQADEILKQIGFTVSKNEVDNSEEETGIVVSQNISQDEVVAEGTEITLDVVK